MKVPAAMISAVLTRRNAGLVIGAVIGMLGFLASLSALRALAENADLSLWVDYGQTVVNLNYNRWDDYIEETDGSFTGLSYAIFVFSLLLGNIIYMKICSIIDNAHVSRHYYLVTSSLGQSIILYALLSVTLDLIFGYNDGFHQVIARLLNLCAFAAASYWGYLIYQVRSKRQKEAKIAMMAPYHQGRRQEVGLEKADELDCPDWGTFALKAAAGAWWMIWGLGILKGLSAGNEMIVVLALAIGILPYLFWWLSTNENRALSWFDRSEAFWKTPQGKRVMRILNVVFFGGLAVWAVLANI